jgi:hypothetical protein
MKFTAPELAHVRSVGLYLTERYDDCGKLLNQSFRYTIKGKAEVYCAPLAGMQHSSGIDGKQKARHAGEMRVLQRQP